MNADIKRYLTEEELRCIAKIRHLLPYDETYDATAEIDLIEQSLAAARKREREMSKKMREILNRYEEESAAAYNQYQDFGCLKKAVEKIAALFDGDEAKE